MNRLQEILVRWPSLAEGAKPQAKDEFHALARGLCAATAKILHVPLSDYRIQNMKAGDAALGDVSFQGPGFFVFIRDFQGSTPTSGCIMRTATPQDKYGTAPEHTNRTLPLAALEAPAALADTIRGLLASKTPALTGPHMPAGAK
jgi:hypothetical protein